MGRHSKYPEEFRRESVQLVLTTDKSMAEVARDLGINYKTLGNWVRQERVDRGEREGLSTEEREELGRLKREVKRLTMERDLLKRSVAFWVKEQDR